MADHGDRKDSSLKILLPVLIVLAAAFVGYELWVYMQVSAPQAVTITPEMQARANEKTEIAIDVDLLKGQVSSILDELPNEAANIKSVSDAHAFAESLKVASEHFGGMQAKNWTAEVKSAVSPLFRNFIEQFNKSLAQAYEVPGVKEVIEPSASSFIRRIEDVFKPDASAATD